jgi:hypothetical protein
MGTAPLGGGRRDVAQDVRAFEGDVELPAAALIELTGGWMRPRPRGVSMRLAKRIAAEATFDSPVHRLYFTANFPAGCAEPRGRVFTEGGLSSTVAVAAGRVVLMCQPARIGNPLGERRQWN